VTLWDKDTFTKDDMIGSLFIDLEECTLGLSPPPHPILYEKTFDPKLSGDEVYYTA
jgi:hypothetical protein